MSYNYINCENPRVLINPKLPELLAKFKRYRLNDVDSFFLFSKRGYYDFPWKQFSPRRNGITPENYEQQFVYSDDSGETFPMYICVPCGHCDLCAESKRNSMVQRMELESLCYNSMPWFVTLTYNDDNCNGELEKRDVQLFLKRLRINLQRAGYIKPIRYAFCGEYGSKTHRPHYHGIIWNICPTGQHDYPFLTELIQKSWQQGFVKCRIINMADNKTFYYTTKYMRKDNKKPDDKKNAPFFLCSKGHGGLGSFWIDEHSREIRKCMNPKYEYYNKFTSKSKPLFFSQYILNRVFPTFCRSVPRELRKACSRLCVNYIYLFHSERWSVKVCDYPIIDEFRRLRDFYKQYVYMPLLSKFDVPWLRTDNKSYHTSVYKEYSQLISECHEDINIMTWFSGLLDFKYLQKLASMRDLFLSKLFVDVTPINIPMKLMKIRNRNALALAREIYV